MGETKKVKKSGKSYRDSSSGEFISKTHADKSPAQSVGETRSAVKRRPPATHLKEFEAVIDRIEDNDRAVLELGEDGTLFADIPCDALPDAAQGGTRLKMTFEVLEV